MRSFVLTLFACLLISNVFAFNTIQAETPPKKVIAQIANKADQVSHTHKHQKFEKVRENVPTDKQKINLNAVDAKTLAKSVRGIGKTKAQAIVSYREKHGSFKTVDELAPIKINGKQLGKKFVDKIRNRVMI